MIVVALNRKKILTYLKLSLIILAVFTFVILTFDQLPKKLSFENWSTTATTTDHPGRVLRVHFDFE